MIVHIKRKDARGHVDLHDTGPGLAPDPLERNFEPGFTTEPRG